MPLTRRVQVFIGQAASDALDRLVETYGGQTKAIEAAILEMDGLMNCPVLSVSPASLAIGSTGGRTAAQPDEDKDLVPDGKGGMVPRSSDERCPWSWFRKDDGAWVVRCYHVDGHPGDHYAPLLNNVGAGGWVDGMVGSLSGEAKGAQKCHWIWIRDRHTPAEWRVMCYLDSGHVGNHYAPALKNESGGEWIDSQTIEPVYAAKEERAKGKAEKRERKAELQKSVSRGLPPPPEGGRELPEGPARVFAPGNSKFDKPLERTSVAPIPKPGKGQK